MRKLFRFLGWSLLSLALLALAGLVLVDVAPTTVRGMLARMGSISTRVSAMLPPQLAAARPVERCVWLPQNWTDEERAWFHNVSQGTATFPVPYSWFRQLQQPELGLLEPLRKVGLVSDPAYLARLGFLAPADCDPPAGNGSPEGYGALPVGFAVLNGAADPAAGTPAAAFVDPTTGERTEPGLGLTCAACHTGRLLYKGTELRIDGGPAMIDLQNLERVIGLSICYTELLGPWRRGRFVNAMLGDLSGAARSDEKERIEAELSRICSNEIFGKVSAEKDILDRLKTVHTDEGFGRLDALNRIGNQVFHENLADPAQPGKPLVKSADGGLSDAELDQNFAARTAPVSFPPIWGVPHFTWAQYDASILSPGVRNVGEAMGVAAKINMRPGVEVPLYSSTVEVETIARIETLLEGKEGPFDGEVGFKGLHAPRWEDAAKEFPGDPDWALKADLVTAGRQLYKDLCLECHRGPVRDPDIGSTDPDWFWNAENSDRGDNWIEISGQKLFNVIQKSVADMGTDPEQARVLAERRVVLPKYLDIDPSRDVLASCGDMEADAGLEKSFVLALMAAVRKVEDQWLLDRARAGAPLSPEAIAAIRGGRPNCPNPGVFRVTRPERPAQREGVRYIVDPVYRARPLDGVWATAPYLHNGSVPTLEDLLTPQAERPAKFCVGPLDFDPKKVGLSRDPTLKLKDEPGFEGTERCEEGVTLFDASVRGNSNLGHSFEGTDQPWPQGVIGPLLTPEQRAALIEYLKTL